MPLAFAREKGSHHPIRLQAGRVKLEKK